MLTTTATDLPRLMGCNGSRLMSPAFPRSATDPTDRDEGNAAHFMAQQAFNGVPIADMINQPAYNNYRMTAEMGEHVEEYLINLQPGQMEIDTSHGTDSYRVNGRADHISYLPTSRTLHVDDFKYGHSPVEPEMNWTLISHAIGYCLFSQVAPTTVVMTIHQPRYNHRDGKTRSWTIAYDRLIELCSQLSDTLTNPSDDLRTDLSWCRHCPALASCPAAREARMNAIDASHRAFDDAIPDDALGYELDIMRTARATLDNHLSALEEMAIYRCKNGAVLDPYALEPQYGNSRWLRGLTADVLSAATRVDLTNRTLVTPAEAKRRKVPEAVVNALTERPLIGTKLVRITADKRARRALNK